MSADQDSHGHGREEPADAGVSCLTDHAHGAVLIEAAREFCRRKGLKLTDIRAAVVEALAQAPQPLGAYDLIEALAERGFKRLAPVSVYRALDFLVRAGLAHKLESRNAFIACPHHHGSDDVVVFLICGQCQRVEEAVSAPVADALARLARARGFRPSAEVLEIGGLCRDCQATTHSPAAAPGLTEDRA